jgi:hypothetical protein
MRRPTKAQRAVLEFMGAHQAALRCDPRLRPAWWLEAGPTVRAQVADSIVAAGWSERTGEAGPQQFFTRTEAGRTALAREEMGCE